MLRSPTLLLVLASCQPTASMPDPNIGESASSATPSIQLTTDRQTYAPGDSVRLVLDNRGEEAVGANLCMSALEQRAGQQWVPAPPLSDEACTADLPVAFPGGRLIHEFRIRPDMPAGEYRFRTRVDDPATNEHSQRASNTFQIRG